MNDMEKALQELSDLAQEQEAAKLRFESKVGSWWENLTEQEREWAFYSVVKRIHKAEVVDRGTYRYALYDVFGFNGAMYSRGMDCGFMALHNSIGDGEDYAAMNSVNRVEVIDNTKVLGEGGGRAYTKYLADDEGIRYQLQDDNKTLKIFIDSITKMG